MAMSCPDCGASLDDTLTSDPCPACGGLRRSGYAVTPPVSARVFAGEVTAVVRQALEELATVSPEELRAVLAGARTTATGEARLAGSADLTFEHRVGQGSAIVAHAELGMGQGYRLGGDAPAVRALVAHPVYGPVILAAVGGALGNLASDAVKTALGKALALLLAGQLQVGQPGGGAPNLAPLGSIAAHHDAAATAPSPPSLSTCHIPSIKGGG